MGVVGAAHTGTGRRSTREHKTSCFLALFLRWFVARTRHHRAARSLPLATTLSAAMSSARTSNLEKHSRSLTKLLRHRVHENGLGHALRPDGYLPLDAVLALPQFAGVTATDVEEIVRTNDKQRMALMKEGGKLYVRANQGHTIRGRRRGGAAGRRS